MNEDKEVLASKIESFMKESEPLEYKYDSAGSKYAHYFSLKLAEHLLQESNTGN
ncbi:hypothetical protein R2S03_18635 [Hafnia alvei]|uniref:hypothetical protein n=1 Tax=Proteus vulgaris TaxID=585 RepID=UPI00299CD74E|nr:hypothetical protein [Proteus vulgaris]WOO49455.1 hypothetical protein R2S03_18635 [Hafnia alvei]WPF03921.1 hypothetical protein SB028_17460 [Proteus vulgaris]